MNGGLPKSGDICGDYRVIGALGAGGMGAVYKVEHVMTRRVEAMKVLDSDLTGGSDDAQRFLREIQVQAQLHHPNIAAVYNAFREGNHAVMVMEFVEGESLKARLERGLIPLAKGIQYVSQVLRALAHAHAAGVIHRDVTPGNIMVTSDGSVKLTDFGLARTAADLRSARQGVPVGSLWYMSPEQVTGNSAMDGRTDIYATGAVLYEVLTGKKLFDLETPFSVMRAHVEAIPAPPSVRNRRVPPVFDSIVMKAVAKDPYARYQSADEFRRALEAVDFKGQPSRLWRVAAGFVVAAAGVAVAATAVHFVPRLTPLVQSVSKAALPKKRTVRAERSASKPAKAVVPAPAPVTTDPPPTGIRVTGGEVDEPSAPPPRRITCPTPARSETPAPPAAQPAPSTVAAPESQSQQQQP
jgi:serine/threonine protein kinase